MELNNRITTFKERVWEYCSLPEMSQGIALWNERKKEKAHRCCFGARIARALDIAEPARANHYKTYHFFKGKEAMLEHLKIDEDQLYFALWLSGADSSPFSGWSWHDNPAKVLNRLALIEWIPNNRDCQLIYKVHNKHELWDKRPLHHDFIYDHMCDEITNKARQKEIVTEYMDMLINTANDKAP